MRVVFMGSPRFAVPSLEYLATAGYELAAVYTQPDRTGGRGRALAVLPVKEAASALGLTVVQPQSLKAPDAVKQLAGFKPDIIVVAAFGQLLPKAVLELPRLGCLNVHPSLLPRFRGASPVAAAILAGDEFSGVSIMFLDEGMDSGPVFSRAQIPVADSDSTASLGDKLSIVGAGLLGEVLVGWTGGELKPHPQDGTKATYCQPITKDEGEIDWRLPAVAIWRRVRAFYPWPGCFTRWRGKTLKIIEAMPSTAGTRAKAGEVVALDSGGFGVGTGDGVLSVLRVQLEGKQVLSAAEFLRGQRGFIGAVLPSN
ncbi:MAG TPA: methionyl-tRNA formyltransferase [Dehalococcoidales bacterium]|nr:methionyl-tRNA formyltransferase [Dehalococcoidales bacterium]